MTEMRCADCVAIACECPKGYLAETVECDVCRFKFALAAPGCAPRITCPECDGHVTYESDAE